MSSSAAIAKGPSTVGIAHQKSQEASLSLQEAQPKPEIELHIEELRQVRV